MRQYLRCLRNVVLTSHIVVIPPNGHSADEKVTYCCIARRGGRLLISQQLASGSAVVTAVKAPTKPVGPQNL
jgi:hypothetical protein